MRSCSVEMQYIIIIAIYVHKLLSNNKQHIMHAEVLALHNECLNFGPAGLINILLLTNC